MTQLEQVEGVWLDSRPASTAKNYRATIRVAEETAQRLFGIGLLDLSKFQLQQVATAMTANCKQNSKGTIYAILRSLFKAVQELEVRVDNPGVHLKSPKTPTRTAQKIMTLEEVKWLVAVATGADRLLVQVLYGAGLRAGELCGLRVGDFNLARRTLFVVGKGNKERTVTVSEGLASLLEGFIRNRASEEPMFKGRRKFGNGGVRPLRPAMIWYRLKQLARKAGLRTAISTHWLRHTHATHAIEAGMNIRDLSRTLGHASIAVTEKHYDHAITRSSPSEFLPSI